MVTLLIGCAHKHTKSQTAMSAHVNYSSSIRILLLEPDIQVSELTASGHVVPNAAWTKQGFDNVRNSINWFMTERNAEIVPYRPTDVVDPYDPEIQLLKLHGAVGASILIAPAIPTRKDRFDWSMGPDVQVLADIYDADYALFVYFRDSFATAGRIAMQLLVELGSPFHLSGGRQFGFASLVDLKTGQVVWFNQFRSDGGDVRAIGSAMEATEDLLTDFPIAQRGDMTTHTASTNPEAHGQRTTSPRQPGGAPSADKAAITTPEFSGKEHSMDGKWVARDGFWIADLIVFDGQFHLKAECGPIVVEGSGNVDDKGRIYKIFGQGRYYNVVVSGPINQLNFVSNSGYCGRTTVNFQRANSIAQGGGITAQTAVMPNPTVSGQESATLGQPKAGPTTENAARTAPDVPEVESPTEETWVARDGTWVLEIREPNHMPSGEIVVIDVVDGRFSTNVSKDGWNGVVSGEIDQFGHLVGNAYLRFPARVEAALFQWSSEPSGNGYHSIVPASTKWNTMTFEVHLYRTASQ